MLQIKSKERATKGNFNAELRVSCTPGKFSLSPAASAVMEVLKGDKILILFDEGTKENFLMKGFDDLGSKLGSVAGKSGAGIQLEFSEAWHYKRLGGCKGFSQVYELGVPFDVADLGSDEAPLDMATVERLEVGEGNYTFFPIKFIKKEASMVRVADNKLGKVEKDTQLSDTAL